MIEITIREGRNRQVRRMAEAVGNEVVDLERIASGRCASASSARGRGAAAARRRAAAALEGSAPMSDGDKRLWAVRGAAQAERNDEPRRSSPRPRS